MTFEELELILESEYQVKLQLKPIYDGFRNNCYCGNDIIFMGEYDDPDILVAGIFHELGHILNSRAMSKKRSDNMSIMSSEGAAWETGFTSLRLQN